MKVEWKSSDEEDIGSVGKLKLHQKTSGIKRAIKLSVSIKCVNLCFLSIFSRIVGCYKEGLCGLLFIISEIEAWFPLNVSVIATNRSCLLAVTLLRFAGFHRQPSFGLLRGLLYLEACKSCSASGIQL